MRTGEDHGCIAYIPMLDIYNTVEQHTCICDVQRHGYMQVDLYYNRLFKPVKQLFSSRILYIYIHSISVYKLFLSYSSAVFLLKYYRSIFAKG